MTSWIDQNENLIPPFYYDKLIIRRVVCVFTSHVVSDTTDSNAQFCIEAIAIEPRVYVDGIWIPAPNTRVRS